MGLRGKKIAILAENEYEDLELWYPYYRLKEESVEVTIVGLGETEYKSKHKYPVKVDTSIDKVKASQFDGIIVPGGFAPDKLRQNEGVLNLIKELNNSKKLVAAICHAGWVLASADIVKGKNVTCVKAIKDDLIHAGGNYSDKEVVRDENIITSRTPEDLPAFCKEILSFLKEN